MENVNQLLAEVDEFSLLVIFLWQGYTQPPLPTTTTYTHTPDYFKQRKKQDSADETELRCCPAIGWLQ